ncbi:glycosyl hydrolase family 1 [Vagococcus fluvialis]|nr:glycosyl hydrolase family 1 [Vagococcus fluvialis]
MWTCMDNWSWTNAYKNRYGFISVDLDNDGQ